ILDIGQQVVGTVEHRSSGDCGAYGTLGWTRGHESRSRTRGKCIQRWVSVELRPCFVGVTAVSKPRRPPLPGRKIPPSKLLVSSRRFVGEWVARLHLQRKTWGDLSREV